MPRTKQIHPRNLRGKALCSVKKGFQWPRHQVRRCCHRQWLWVPQTLSLLHGQLHLLHPSLSCPLCVEWINSTELRVFQLKAEIDHFLAGTMESEMDGCCFLIIESLWFCLHSKEKKILLYPFCAYEPRPSSMLGRCYISELSFCIPLSIGDLLL